MDSANNSLSARFAAGDRQWDQTTGSVVFDPSDRQKVVTIVCWKWHHPTYRSKYTAKHVNVLKSMLSRNCSRPYRLICITDDPKGVETDTFPLWEDYAKMQNPNGFNFPCCYRRLKLFSTETTRALEVPDGERVLSIDLDVVLTGDIGKLFDRGEDFVGWKGMGSFNPVVYNGSLFMFRAGRLDWLWNEFDPDVSPITTRKARFFGSDQGWLSFRLARPNPDPPGWDKIDGIFSYSRDGHMRDLPTMARAVFFNGKMKPWDKAVMQQSRWIKRYWR